MQENAPRPRPARGLPPEEALERWSNPEAYAAMREYWDARQGVSPATGKPPAPKVLRHWEYKRRREPLEEAFHALLEEGRLLATAVLKSAEPTAARLLVDPEVFADAHINWEWGDIRGHSRPYNLQLVEIFEPPGIPQNVRVIEDWYWEDYEPRPSTAQEAEAASQQQPGRQVASPGFSYHADYRHVRLNGIDFSLTRAQALVVKQLHEAYLADKPWVYGLDLLLGANSSSEKLSQLFRRMTLPERSLLIESDGRGFYRLNIPE